ncbi:SMR family transporter [Rhodopseudomonas sp. G2_2311]|uniref:SMR family transporter n=1 Tax=Rhodopseudomonas sp. G2_2311 TaxID=3114287 RepID=UPI0039C5CB9F
MGVGENLLILISVSLSTLSQIILKRGMIDAEIQAVIRQGDIVEIAVAIARSPQVIGGLSCFALSAVVWLFVLSRVPLSYAYPFVALGIVATVVSGAVHFGEPVSLQAIAGVALIVSGVVLVGMTR